MGVTTHSSHQNQWEAQKVSLISVAWISRFVNYGVLNPYYNHFDFQQVQRQYSDQLLIASVEGVDVEEVVGRLVAVYASSMINWTVEGVVMNWSIGGKRNLKMVCKKIWEILKALCWDKGEYDIHCYLHAATIRAIGNYFEIKERSGCLN